MNQLLRAMVRQRGLVSEQKNSIYLIKALMEDEYGVKLHFPKKTPSPNDPAR